MCMCLCARCPVCPVCPVCMSVCLSAQARHAEEIGATAIACMSPSYFKPTTEGESLTCMYPNLCGWGAETKRVGGRAMTVDCHPLTISVHLRKRLFTPLGSEVVCAKIRKKKPTYGEDRKCGYVLRVHSSQSGTLKRLITTPRVFTCRGSGGVHGHSGCGGAHNTFLLLRHQLHDWTLL